MLVSSVLVGFVPVSKLNCLGLSECGEAVVEFANHNFESVGVFCTDVPDCVDAKLDVLKVPLLPPLTLPPLVFPLPPPLPPVLPPLPQLPLAILPNVIAVVVPLALT